MIDNKKPYIICAAIHFDDGEPHIHQPRNIKTGFVVTGWRHHNIFMTMNILGYDRLEALKGKQGFLTSQNMFLTRDLAKSMATSIGQAENVNGTLTSEDLY